MALVSHWYVVQTKPHKETVAVENLERQGYKAYCPLITQAKHRGKRWQQVTEPLFPRYLFVKLKTGIDNFSPIRSTLGVQKLVGFGNQPATISQNIISLIQQQERKVAEQGVGSPQWECGDPVEIVDGPFSGFKGLFEKQSGEERVVVLLQLLGRDSRVAVSINSVVPV